MWSTNVFCCAVFVVSGLMSVRAAPRIIFEDMKDYGRIEIRLLEPDDVCGVPRIKPDLGNNSAQNIAGGKEAIPHSWPWQIELQRDGKFYCGGSILGRRWVVTAAHCLGGDKPVDPERIAVVVGEHDRTQPEPLKKKFQATALYVHEKYNPETDENDIGLIDLGTETKLKFNRHVQPVCLQTTDFKEGTMCATVGWGMDRWPSQSPHGKFRGFLDPHLADKLMEVAIPIYSQTECVKAYNSSGETVFDSMICAGYPQGGKDACAGDAGGPLVSQGPDGVWQLIGITSWGNDCAQPNYPGVYTRVKMFNDWIKNIMD